MSTVLAREAGTGRSITSVTLIITKKFLEPRMGGIHRIKKKFNPGIMLAKTGLVFGGSDVCLVVDDNNGSAKAKAFAYQCLYNAKRSSMTNLNDVLSTSSVFRTKLLAGDPIWN